MTTVTALNMLLPFAPTAITTTTPMLVRLMGSMAQTGSSEASLSVPAPGTTVTDTVAVTGIAVTAMVIAADTDTADVGMVTAAAIQTAIRIHAAVFPSVAMATMGAGTTETAAAT